jgi:metal-responsive CopG/Arc/MetJ family transcriptional regulator
MYLFSTGYIFEVYRLNIKKYRLRVVTLKLPEQLLMDIDELVASKRYATRSEVIRVAIRELLKKEKVVEG